MYDAQVVVRNFWKHEIKTLMPGIVNSPTVISQAAVKNPNSRWLNTIKLFFMVKLDAGRMKIPQIVTQGYY